MRPAVRRIAARGRSALTASAAGRVIDGQLTEASRVAQLLSSGLVDRGHYERQVGLTFRSDREAVRHYLRDGRSELLSLSPLFEEAWYARSSGDAGGDRFLSMFFGSEPLASASPLFDARVYADRCAAAGEPVPTTTREALESFLRSARPDDALPVDPVVHGTVSLEEARRRVAASIDQVVSPRPPGDRSVLSWDADREYEVREGLGREQSTFAAERPTVSIVMPVKDRSSVVGIAIASVRAQTLTSWELHVVDDGSSDGTAEAVLTAAAGDPRVVLHRGPSRGVGAARNTAIEASSGRFVAFLDSDNTWDPDFLRLTTAALARPGVDAVYTASHVHGADGTERYLAVDTTYADLLTNGNAIDLNTLVVERDLLQAVGGFDESIRRWVDYDLVLRLFARTTPRLLPFLGVEYSHDDDPDRITNRETVGWETVVLSPHLADWDAERRRTDRLPGSLSVVVDAAGPWWETLSSVRSACVEVRGEAAEVVLVDRRADHTTSHLLRLALGGDERVSLLTLPRDLRPSLGRNIGFLASSGSTVAFVDAGVTVDAAWLNTLAAELDADPAVGLVGTPIVGVDGRVHSAGYALGGERMPPWLFLGGHPAEDVHPTVPTTIPAPDGAAMMMRARDLVEARGFDPLFAGGLDDVDLALRMHRDRGLRSRIVGGAAARRLSVPVPPHERDESLAVFLDRWPGGAVSAPTELYAPLGFDVDGVDLGAARHRSMTREVRPRLRRNASSGEARRPRWSVRFDPLDTGSRERAYGLVHALRRRSVDAVSDGSGPSGGPTDGIEDVVVMVGGTAVDAGSPAARHVVVRFVEVTTESAPHVDPVDADGRLTLRFPGHDDDRLADRLIAVVGLGVRAR